MSNYNEHPVFVELKQRFENTMLVEQNGVPLVFIPKTRDRNYSLLTTIGMSDFEMPVPEKHQERSKIELFFCLPDYWKPEEMENPNHNWVWDRITFMSGFPKERNTWFGNGHTMPFNREETAISEKFQQEYFFFTDPFELTKEMRPIRQKEGNIHFIAVVPIFKRELDFKNKAGGHSLLRKFVKKGVSEKVDMFRLCAVRKRLFFK